VGTHEVWHVVVLTATLLGTGGLVIVALAPLVFESPPPGLRGARPVVLALALLAAVVLLVEWLLIH
jgi:hypothetical protein